MNGELVTEALLRHGDVLEIDDVVVLLFTIRMDTLERRGVTAASLGPFGLPDAQGIIGEGPAACRLREQIAFAAQSGAHVVLGGDSGTGKELTARGIHRQSSRAAMPFIARSAATFTTELIVPELFGHARGFPNAGMPARAGIIGDAEGGTVFLDEIGELPLAMQGPLLRVFDPNGEYTRMGESQPRYANVRFITATNRPLSELKHDLLARLTVQIELPSLNARREDIPLLVRHLLHLKAAKSPQIAQRFVDCSATGNGDVRVEAALIVALLRHDYTTNIRELDALLWKAMLASKRDKLEVPNELKASDDDVEELLSGLGAEPRGTEVPEPVAAPEPPDAGGAGEPDWTDAEVIACLVKYHFHLGKAAAALGMSRHALGRRVRKLKAEGKI